MIVNNLFALHIVEIEFCARKGGVAVVKINFKLINKYNELFCMRLCLVLYQEKSKHLQRRKKKERVKEKSGDASHKILNVCYVKLTVILFFLF